MNSSGAVLLIPLVLFPILGVGGVIVWGWVMKRFDLLDRMDRLFEWLTGTKDV